MFKAVRTLIAATVIGAATFVTVPAEAATDSSRSPESASAALDNFRLYLNSDFGSCYTGASGLTLFSGSLEDQVYGVLSCDRSVSNSTSSMRNDYGQNIYLYDGENCTGVMYTARPNSEDSTFSNNDFNDKASCIAY